MRYVLNLLRFSHSLWATTTTIQTVITGTMENNFKSMIIHYKLTDAMIVAIFDIEGGQNLIYNVARDLAMSFV